MLCDSLSQPSSQDVAQVIDQGTLWPMTVAARLALHPSSAEAPGGFLRPTSLQSLIIQWRNQASRHAMTDTPAWLVLQVSRFDDAGCKLGTPVSISDAVYIPYFTGDSLMTSSARYQVLAAVYHLGPSLLTGHYRAALCRAGVFQYVTDDGVSARATTDEDVQQIQSNAYLFFVRKC